MGLPTAAAERAKVRPAAPAAVAAIAEAMKVRRETAMHRDSSDDDILPQ
jgi:hypothetical protein